MAEDRLTAPKPLEEHKRLAAFAGEWAGEETVYPSRWNAGKDLSFVPLRPELVVEVPVVGDPDDIDTQEDLARWS